MFRFLLLALLVCAEAARPALRVTSSRSLENNALVAQPEPQLQASSGLSGLLASVDVPLLMYFAFWYLGNYYYTLSNKRALGSSSHRAERLARTRTASGPRLQSKSAEPSTT